MTREIPSHITPPIQSRKAMVKRTLISLVFGASCAFAQIPTGAVYNVQPQTTNCQPGWTCYSFNVSCPNVYDAHPVIGMMARMDSTITPVRGMAVYFSGANGGAWFNDTVYSQNYFAQENADGFDVVQVRWLGDGWSNPWGINQGFEAVACRPA